MGFPRRCGIYRRIKNGMKILFTLLILLLAACSAGNSTTPSGGSYVDQLRAKANGQTIPAAQSTVTPTTPPVAEPQAAPIVQTVEPTTPAAPRDESAAWAVVWFMCIASFVGGVVVGTMLKGSK